MLSSREKLTLTFAALVMGACVICLGAVSLGGGAYLVWAETQTQAPVMNPAPVDLPEHTEEAGFQDTQAEIVGLWQRGTGDDHHLAMFGPMTSAGFGYFNSSSEGEGGWFAGPDPNTVLVVTEHAGLIPWTVSFTSQGRQTRMTLTSPHGSDTWAKIAALN